MNARFLTDEAGRKTAVLLANEDYERLLEDIENLAAIAGRRNEPAIGQDKAKIEQNGRRVPRGADPRRVA